MNTQSSQSFFEKDFTNRSSQSFLYNHFAFYSEHSPRFQPWVHKDWNARDTYPKLKPSMTKIETQYVPKVEKLGYV